MKKSLQFAFVLGHLACATLLFGACGGDESSPVIAHPPPDASVVLPDAQGCDPLTQDCTAETEKCSIDLSQPDDTTSIWATTCRAITGTVAVGEHCTRSAEGAPGVGKDNCVEGGYCTAIGDLAGNVDATARVCRTFCRSSGSCDKTQTCLALTSGLTPNTGICVNRCNIMVDDGTCTGGAWCAARLNFENQSAGFCVKTGTAAVGATCSDTINCVSKALCVTSTPAGGGAPTSACRASCDIVVDPAVPMFPCEAGFTCKPFTMGPTDWGFCAPN